MPKLLLSQFVPAGLHCHVGTSVLTHVGRPAEHGHDFLELFWCDRGRGWHWINGQQRPLALGTLVLIRAQDVHGFSRSEDQPLRIFNVAFAPETWTYLFRRYLKPGRDLWASKDIGEREWNLSPAQVAELTRTAAELRAGARSREAIERFLLNVVYLIHSIESARSSTDLPEWLGALHRQITRPEHFQRGTVGLAELAGKSPEHVARAVRKYFHTTPTGLLNEARMAYAAERLTSTDDDILNICIDCGLENLSHFYALFRKRWGVAPNRYRHQQQGIVRPG